MGVRATECASELGSNLYAHQEFENAVQNRSPGEPQLKKSECPCEGQLPLRSGLVCARVWVQNRGMCALEAGGLG